MINISSWGMRGTHPHRLHRFTDPAVAQSQIPASAPGLATGLQRSYGDVSLNTGGTMWDLSGMNALIDFDEHTGVLRSEAGVELGELQRTFAPLGWMLPVTPGSQHVTIGGAIANDVHGKNHHIAGTFGAHLIEIELLRTDGEVIVCGPKSQQGLFNATVGGLGLTGVILSATLQLEPVSNPYISTESITFQTLSEFFSLSRELDDPYTVSWIDVTTNGGRRGIFHRGERATVEQGLEIEARDPKTARRLRGDNAAASRSARLRVPITPPFSLVNRLTLPLLNRGYYGLQAAASGPKVVDYESFFYPLDAISEWNRMYGPRGFFQFQSVVPWNSAEEATAEMLRIISRSGEGSFLGVLKALGDIPSPGLLSYPSSGINFTLDFPDRGSSTLRLLDTLEHIAVEAGGRLYPAKDARMSRETFRMGYPNLELFTQHRDPGLTSDLARRLLDD